MMQPGRRGRLSKLLSLLYQTPLQREREFYRRLRELSEVIDKSPNDMTHRVLRGELYVKRGEYERAKVDFEAALDVAAMDESKGWLAVEQVMRDRALYGLKLSQRHS